MEEMQSPRREYRSMFWPMVLIGAGVLFLLQNVGVLPNFNWMGLVRYWPVLLILGGLDILLARNAPALGAVLGLAVVGGVVALLILNPPAPDDSSFGFPVVFGEDVEAQDYYFEAPLEGAETAEVEIRLSVPRADIRATDNAGSAQLITADIRDVIPVEFEVSGSGAERNIDLRSDGMDFVFGPQNLFDFSTENLHWDVRLNPNVVYDLEIRASAGSSDVDLRGLILSALRVDASAGSMELNLPAGNYEGEINGSAGSTSVTFEPDSNVRMVMEPSAGSMNINVPEGAAVRVILEDGGVGSFSVPGSFEQVEADDDDSEAGVYETANAGSASTLIEIVINSLSLGSVSINLY